MMFQSYVKLPGGIHRSHMDPASARADDAGRHEFRDGLLQLGVLAESDGEVIVSLCILGIPWYPFPKI